MALKRVIKLLGEPIQTEFDEAGAAITPGMLLSYDGSGNLVPHASAGGASARQYAMHREEGTGATLGKTDIDAAYAVGDTVKVGAFAPGCQVNVLIPSGQTITKGNFLESNGNGMLKVFSAGVRQAYAEETVNNSAGPGSARLRVTIV